MATFTPEQLNALAANAEQAANLLKAMSNQSRLMILCSLIDEEMTVGQLNERIPLSQSALSQHLAALRKAGLVSTRREAQTIYYQLQGKAPQQIISVLKDTFCPQ
ncbi:MAG: metalloregulator ArsR/SmtB family transcription factor [Pseudomonadales bacterium]|nr:metalloregulator ArsR/SmtB family transcription factor [Pseudomonadales bacterium]